MKKIEVCDGPYKLYFISAHITFKEDNSPADTLYLVLAHDARYTSITELITVKSGSFNDIWNFFSYCLEFLQKEEVGMSNTLEIPRYLTTSFHVTQKLKLFGYHYCGVVSLARKLVISLRGISS